MWVFFGVLLGLVTFAVAWLLYRYPARGVPLQVKVVVGYAWLTTLMICCIVPLDVVATLQGSSPGAIAVLWDIPYWSTQALTWMLIPLMMEFSNAGEFTWRGRMWRAVKNSLTFWAMVVSCAAIGLTWGSLNGTLDLAHLPDLKSLGIQLSNTFGLVCVLALMGFGLVNIPRSLWKHSNPEACLRHQYYQLGRILEENEHASKSLGLAITKVLATKKALGRSERESLAHIEDMLHFIRDHTGDDVEAESSRIVASLEYADELPQLHAKVMKEVYHKGAINVRTAAMIRRAVWLSEVQATRAGREPRTGGLALKHSLTSWSRISWRFWCFVWPYVLKALALAALVLGALILWCQVVIGFDTNLSPLSMLVHTTHQNDFVAQAIVLSLLVYIITCTYTAFFEIEIGSLYRLTPRASSSFSLLFNGTMMARFAAPLCTNYLHVIRMNTPQHGRYTTFATKMGLDKNEDVAIPFLAIGFNTWAPWLLMAVVIIVASNALDKVYRALCCCFPQGYADNEDDEGSQRYVMEGEKRVEMELRALADSSEMDCALLTLSTHSSSAPVTHTLEIG